MKGNIYFKIKENIEFLRLNNNKREFIRVRTDKNIFDYTKLDKEDLKYVKDDMQSIKSHNLIESRQQILWRKNTTGEIIKSEIININTITHNKSKEDILIKFDDFGRKEYLNSINIKMCNTDSKVLKDRIKILENNEFLELKRDVLMEKIDDRVADWFECMKIMNNNSSRCYNVMFWKENKMNKIEFYLNNNISIDKILENANIISTFL